MNINDFKAKIKNIFLEDIAPTKPKSKISKRKLVKNKGTNTAHEIIQYSFNTKAGNNVKVHFKPQYEDSYDVIFYVNDTLDDNSSTMGKEVKRDKDILNGVLYTVKKKADELGAKELTFEAWEGEGDSVIKKDMDLEKPATDLLKIINHIQNKVEKYDPIPIPPSKLRLELSKETGKPLKQLYDIDKDKILDLLNNLKNQVVNKDPSFFQTRQELINIITNNNSTKHKTFNKIIDPEKNLQNYMDLYKDALKSHDDEGTVVKRNRRGSLYERLMNRYFSNEWDIKKEGKYFTLNRKQK